jgi:archaellin
MKTIKYAFSLTIAVAIITLSFAAFQSSPAMAYTVGPNNAGLGENRTGVGTAVWLNPNNITIPVGSDPASVLVKKGFIVTNYLWATNYGFNLPEDATINGVQVVINRQTSAHNPSIVDNMVSLVSDTGLISANKAYTNTWPLAMGTATYGGPTDLWGITTLSPAVVNSTAFGVALSATRDNNGNSDRFGFVDYIQVSVYYGYPTTTTVDCGNGNPVTVYGTPITCVATVTSLLGVNPPAGTVSWQTNGSGTFTPSPCTLMLPAGVSNCSVTYTPTAVGTGPHQVTATYNGSDSFTYSSGSQSVIVNARPVTVTADPKTKVFGDLDPALTYHISSGSLVFSDNFTGALTRNPGENAGAYAILQGTLALSENYALTYVGDYLTITKANASCQVTPYNSVYDALPHTATGLCTGLGEVVLEGLDLSGTTHTNAGSYNDPWMFTDVTGNYNNTSGSVNDVISKRPLTITADTKSKFVGQPDPVLTYTVTSGAFLPGDAATGALTRQPGETLGTYGILQGTLSVSANYSLTFNGATFTITEAKYFLPITFR